jgi:methionyl-tRNA formyltransferase
VLLVAEDAAGVQALRAIAASRHRLGGVIASGQHDARRGATVRDLAMTLGCPVWPPEVVRDPQFGQALRDIGIDVLLNVYSLQVIAPALLQAPAIGAFNLHPGPLPEYAGLNAPSWAIYNGEQCHAVTLHWMEAEIDTGAIAYRQRLEMAEDETGLTLSVKCVQAGIPLLLQLLDVAARDPGAIPRAAQDRTRRRYFGKEVPERGCLSWPQPAHSVVRFVRACDYLPLPSPWGHPGARLDGQPLRVLKAFRTWRPCIAPAGKVGEVAGARALVAAADEWVALERLELAGRSVNAAEVLTSGCRLENG